ncbi:MAG: hypothetical protein ACK5FT_09735 [Sphingomonadales bacterium]|jgi:hypothetical protein
MRKTFFLLSVSLVVFAVACKDEKKAEPNYPSIEGKTVRQILMMQDWKFSEWADSVENAEVWLDQMEPCMKDDVFSFISTTKYKVIENTNNCYPPDPSYEVNYSMASDNSNIVRFFDNTDWELISKSNARLVFWKSYNSGLEQHFQKLVLTRN